jgi:hypothetical protein
VPEERELQRAVAESLGHVAAVDEQEIEQPAPSISPDGESTRVEAPHGPARHVKDDDHTDPQAHADAVRSEGPGRQQHERRVVSGLRPVWWCGGDAKSHDRPRLDPEPPRAQADPLRGAARPVDAWSSAQRARERRR